MNDIQPMSDEEIEEYARFISDITQEDMVPLQKYSAFLSQMATEVYMSALISPEQFTRFVANMFVISYMLGKRDALQASPFDEIIKEASKKLEEK